ncbi:hypothetical protein DICSQDRAFT_124865 [Dichomitus squalens LYAD-421 SS1]|uniref:uncharacterized protein n=1 Tax=Dichomitus squalens (strain LYAD-421) TaxID=732165 RepID=UPI0004410835|nr:uncharacterized protein DICSQDRAFT_124865 [Dichomitus squalens LYAD-421 SS1]EJF64667.1 hypothetical protein DICSQDRAFT_124865 [Dichomitus squalens LYAD-421 SS1]
MQFFALIAAALATVAIAAPADQGCQLDQTGKHDEGLHSSKSGNSTGKHDQGSQSSNSGNSTGQSEKVQVGYTLDLNNNTTLGSLSCSSVFDQKYPEYKNYTLGQLPVAPFFAEVPGATYGSSKCGSCWEIQYNNKTPVYVLGVDDASIFQLSKAGFKKLAGKKGLEKGSVSAQAVEVSPTYCGLQSSKQ